MYYRQISNISRTLVGNKIGDHSDIVGASSIGAAPTTSSLSTIHLLSGVSDFFDRNKILSGYDLSHYQVPHCIKSFLLFCLICVYSSQFSILFWIMYLL